MGEPQDKVSLSGGTIATLKAALGLGLVAGVIYAWGIDWMIEIAMYIVMPVLLLAVALGLISSASIDTYKMAFIEWARRAGRADGAAAAAAATK